MSGAPGATTDTGKEARHRRKNLKKRGKEITYAVAITA